ncbi:MULTISPECIES: tyrosine-type recombinase/integrase [Paraburkholderia]|uniref:Integrase family protein n=1 Tax=Paraburkholderia podalyriae TaxID=1938811 RepID=A0ABR7PFQ9_9BURK|nr:integrase family protein [Paraburkholderia podalyriae]MBC8745212.1 integrase family protein [Paraburkholderia podalyriae]
MAKINFTAARVAAHKCPDGKAQSFLWDSKAPGLGLRATGAGAKAYIFQGKLNGATVRITIGDALNWTIEQAQERARELQTSFIDKGIDPREHAEKERAAAVARKAEARRQDALFGEAWEAYLNARKVRWSDRHYQDHIQHADEGGKPKKRGQGVTVAGPLASLRPLKLSALTSEHIAQWLDGEARERPTMTALSFRLLRGFIRWADDTPTYRGVIPADSYRSRGVKDAVPRTKAKEGDSLQREQLPAWFASVRNIGNPVISAYLQALLITGARREEMLALRWVDVDFQWRSLSIADKVEQDTGRTIPLTPYLAALLAALPRRNEWVFSSTGSESGHVEEPRVAHNQALDVAGLPHVSLHGLRRSFGTLAEWCEVPVGVVAQIQGHKPSAIAEKHYRRRPLDLLRKWHDNIEAWMLEQAGIDFRANVTAPGLRVVSNG